MNLIKLRRRRNRSACEYGGCSDLNSPVTQCGPRCEPCAECRCCHSCHPLMDLG